MVKNTFLNMFDIAEKEGDDFVFVGIEAEGIKEVICIPKESFKAKKEFYKRSYTDDMVHVMNKNVFIYKMAGGNAEALNEAF